MNTLIFSQTTSIPSWKAMNSVSELNILKNPASGKIFFATDNRITGKVSTFEGDLAISWCEDSESKGFWMIHKKGSSTENILASL